MKYIIFERKYPHHNSNPGFWKRTYWERVGNGYQQRFGRNSFEPPALSHSAMETRFRKVTSYYIGKLTQEEWDEVETKYFVKSL